MRTFHVEFDLEVEDDDVRQLPEFEVTVKRALDCMLPEVPYLDYINFSVTPTEEGVRLPQWYDDPDHSIRDCDGECESALLH